MMTSVGEEEARVLLQEEQARLQQIRASLQADPLDGAEERAIVELSMVDQHPADIASDTFEKEKDLSILEHVDAQLVDVDRALGRLELGTYGTCEAVAAGSTTTGCGLAPRPDSASTTSRWRSEAPDERTRRSLAPPPD